MKTTIKQTGFTLMELMMSLGILVAGLSFIATAFPVAMLETKHSIADTSATMISENAAAICRVKFLHNAIKGSVSDAQLGDLSSLITRAERAYPIAQGDHLSHGDDWVEIPSGSGTYYPSSRYGWLLAARQPTDNDTNDYQLIIVPYRKFLPGDLPPSFSDVTTDGNKVTGSISIGSPVICKADGTFAYVLDSTGTLTGPITSGPALAVGADGKDSPAIGCYVVRTSVRP